MAEGIGVLDGECEGWAVYQEWVGGGWVMIGWRQTLILDKSVILYLWIFESDFASFSKF